MYKPLIFSLLFMLIEATVVHSQSSSAVEKKPLETKVKAAYLFNFSKFVQWPGKNGTPVTICVIGDKEVGGLLEELKLQLPAEKSFRVIYDPDAVPSSCHILYIADNVKDRDRYLEKCRNKQVLTVSDSSDFTRSGGIVRFFSANGRIRFEINVTNADAAGIKISSKLLELGSIVR